MGKIIGIDYGKKRVGLAMTDDLQIIASGLTTVDEKDIFTYLTKCLNQNKVDGFVIGEPRKLDNSNVEMTNLVHVFGNRLQQIFPDKTIHFIDERFTSKIAARTLVESGLKKKDRQNKALLDEVSATLILQAFLEQKSFNI